MEAYANALLIAIPCFMVLLLVEMAYGYTTGKQTYVFMDTISSLSSGLTNILKDTLGLVVILISYPWLSQQLAITQIDAGVWLYVHRFCFLLVASPQSQNQFFLESTHHSSQ
jgi:alkylglycerol monooxygenase